MTFRDDVDADVSDVFLDTDELAQTFTQNVGGDTGTQNSVAGVFVPHLANRQDIDSERITYTASLYVNRTVAVTDDDTWIIRGDTWQTTSLGEEPGIGLRELTLKRTVKRKTMHGAMRK